MVRLVIIHIPAAQKGILQDVIDHLQYTGKICHVVTFLGQQENKQIQFKTKDKHLQRVLDEIQARGVGKTFGQIDVLPVLLSKPGMSFIDQRDLHDGSFSSRPVSFSASTILSHQHIHPFEKSQSSSDTTNSSTSSNNVIHNYTNNSNSNDTNSYTNSNNSKNNSNSNSSSKSKKRRLYRMDDRMTVDEIDAFIDDGNHLTFNYMMLLFCASLIAGAGLIGDSATTVIAAMLVSPLMGPILSITFGLAIQQRESVYRGLRNEMVGIVISFVTGLMIGVIATGIYAPHYRSNEMVERGEVTGLAYGFIVAFASGIAVVVAITMGGVNAIVGTAISASLLPPVVNSGICLAMATVYSLVGRDDSSGNSRWMSDAREYAMYSLVSFSLFLVNFVVIVAVGFITFRYVKNVCPPSKEEKQTTSAIPLTHFASSALPNTSSTDYDGSPLHNNTNYSNNYSNNSSTMASVDSTQ